MPLKKSFKADIILDARMISHSGIGTYLRGLISSYPSQPFLKGTRLGLALPRSLFSEVDGKGIAFPFNAPVYSVREQIEYPFQLRGCRLWHSPHYNVPLIKGRTRLVVTVHDLIHWIFRKEFYSSIHALYVRQLFCTLIRSADRVITVSHQTKADLVQYFNAAPEKIRVIHEGVDASYFEGPSAEGRATFLTQYALPESYFLYVGLIKPHKNVMRLIKVYQRLRSEKRIDTPLVIVGRKDRNYPKGFELLKELGNSEGIFYLPRVENQRELACLYASAKALIHPSLYEGFGLTCLEAMASGTPVVVSRAASLPEVVDDAGYYIDPYSEASIEEALLTMETDDSLRTNLSEKGKRRARKFSWAKTAEETIQVYREVLT